MAYRSTKSGWPALVLGIAPTSVQIGGSWTWPGWHSQADGAWPPGLWLPGGQAPAGSAGGSGDVGGDDVGGMAVQGRPGAVIAHGGPRIRVRRGVLHIAQRYPGIQGGGDKGPASLRTRRVR